MPSEISLPLIQARKEMTPFTGGKRRFSCSFQALRKAFLMSIQPQIKQTQGENRNPREEKKKRSETLSRSDSFLVEEI